jgi:hypothetical protein
MIGERHAEALSDGETIAGVTAAGKWWRDRAVIT